MSRKPYKKLLDILEDLSFKKSDITDWISEDRVKKKRDSSKKGISDKLSNIVCSVIKFPSYSTLLELFTMIKSDLRWRAKRVDIFSSVFTCLRLANENATSVLEEMKKRKNRIRQVGRKVEGRCIGTTLLTKGLEFDTVVLIEADRINSSQDFYVAISRACKEVHIFTSSLSLHFKK